MNSYERKEMKRVRESRTKWKSKAMERNKALRSSKSKIRDIEKSREMWREKYFSEKEKADRNSLPCKVSVPITDHSDPGSVRFIIIAICINLTINCCVSFRSVPKIMEVFKNLLRLFGINADFRIPHFTTVIRRTLRVGTYLSEKALKEPVKERICIADHTIQVGTEKAFAVLRVPIEVLKKTGALTLKDVEVLYIKVREKRNGAIVQEVLESLFLTAGYPRQIVIDGGPDLNRGIKNILKKLKPPFKVTYDVTHLIAKLLKKKYGKHEIFSKLTSHLSETKIKILQTSLAYLIPLKERTESRFLNLPSIAKYTKQIINYLSSLPAASEEEQAEREKLTENFSWIFEYSEFLTDFQREIGVLSQFQKILKTEGINALSYRKVCNLLNEISDPVIKNPLTEYVDAEYKFASESACPVPVTSDSIESLFGKYKYPAKPHSMSEINRMILSLPCICRDIDPLPAEKAFSIIQDKDVVKWCEEEISETLLSKRRKVFDSVCEKNDVCEVISFPTDRQQNTTDTEKYDGQKIAGTALCLTG